MFLDFYDKADIDVNEKTAISLRDGTLDYLGAEIGMEPADKIFRIYRSPATIANVAFKMEGIPLCDGHIDVDMPVEKPMGHVTTSKMIDLFDEQSNAQLAIENKIQLKDRLFRVLATKDKELSLGYKARLIECQHGKPFDFEQIDIEPRHLAIVERGRCGHECRFLDTNQEIDDMKNKKAAKKKFVDADGAPNLEEIVSLATEIPELLKKLPADELLKVIPVLQEIKSKADNALDPDNDGDAGGDEDGDGDGKTMEMEDTDDETETMDEEKDDMEDEDDTEEDDEKKSVTDAAMIKAAVKEHAQVTEKARGFLDEKYKFAERTANEIMRDVLKKEFPKESFTDAELAVAFKTLRPRGTDLKNFGDVMPDGKGKFTAYYNKEK